MRTLRTVQQSESNTPGLTSQQPQRQLQQQQRSISDSVPTAVASPHPSIIPIRSERCFNPGFKYAGPYFSDGQTYWFDEILDRSVWPCDLAEVDECKANFLPVLGHLAEVMNAQHLPAVHPVGSGCPTVFLLTSGDGRTLPHAMRSASRFHELGYSVLPVRGFGSESDDALNTNGVPRQARRGHLAWLLSFLPKLLQLTAGFGDSAKFIIAEDSALPIRTATPNAVQTLVRKHGCVWCGYRSSNYPPPKCTVHFEISESGKVKRLQTPRKPSAPYGLKMLCLNHKLIAMLYRAFTQLPAEHCAEDFFQALIGSGHLCVVQPIAGSDNHFSLVDGREQEVVSRNHPTYC